MKRAFVDTNVWVYAVDRDEPDRQASARQLLRDLGSGAVLSTQVMAEYHVTVTRKLGRPVPLADAGQHLQRMARLQVVPTDAALVVEAAALALSHQLSLWDAMVVRAAAVSGCEVLHTEDLTDGQILDGIRISNPFT